MSKVCLSRYRGGHEEPRTDAHDKLFTVCSKVQVPGHGPPNTTAGHRGSNTDSYTDVYNIFGTKLCLYTMLLTERQGYVQLFILFCIFLILLLLHILCRCHDND